MKARQSISLAFLLYQAYGTAVSCNHMVWYRTAVWNMVRNGVHGMLLRWYNIRVVAYGGRWSYVGSWACVRAPRRFVGWRGSLLAGLGLQPSDFRKREGYILSCSFFFFFFPDGGPVESSSMYGFPSEHMLSYHVHTKTY